MDFFPRSPASPASFRWRLLSVGYLLAELVVRSCYPIFAVPVFLIDCRRRRQKMPKGRIESFSYDRFLNPFYARHYLPKILHLKSSHNSISPGGHCIPTNHDDVFGPINGMTSLPIELCDFISREDLLHKDTYRPASDSPSDYFF